MNVEFAVIVALAVAVAAVAVWRPRWVWAPISGLVAFFAYLFGSRMHDREEDVVDGPGEPSADATDPEPPDHTPEDRSDTMVDIARDDDVSDDLDDELDDISSDAEQWRDSWLD